MIAATRSRLLPPRDRRRRFAYQREVDAKRKLIVGVNAFQEPDEKPIEMLTIDDVGGAGANGGAAAGEGAAQSATTCDGRWTRSAARPPATENLMPPLLEAARARATVGEVMNALADVFGRYEGAAKW